MFLFVHCKCNRFVWRFEKNQCTLFRSDIYIYKLYWNNIVIISLNQILLLFFIFCAWTICHQKPYKIKQYMQKQYFAFITYFRQSGTGNILIIKGRSLDVSWMVVLRERAWMWSVCSGRLVGWTGFQSEECWYILIYAEKHTPPVSV